MSGAHLKTASFTTRATMEQSARWKRAAEAEGHASVGSWLGAAADSYLRIRAKAGLPLPLAWTRGRVRVDLADGSTVDLPAWRAQPFAIFRGDLSGPGLAGCKVYSLLYLPDRRLVATFRYARYCKALAAELAGPLIRGMPPPEPGGIVERHRREDV